jgi:hypothetical protein
MTNGQESNTVENFKRLFEKDKNFHGPFILHAIQVEWILDGII